MSFIRKLTREIVRAPVDIVEGFVDAVDQTTCAHKYSRKTNRCIYCKKKR